MNLINEGIKQGLIKFDDEQKYITYLNQNKQRNYNNPEEKVQAETFLKLILVYGYSPERILQFVSVTMGSSTKESDIIVYNDDQKQSPHILVECKKQEVSELEFKQAIDQAFSYAIAEGAKYVWVTSGIKDEYFEVPKEKPKARISIPDIPQFGVTKLAKYKYAKGGGEVNRQRLFELEKVTEDDLTRRFKQAHNALWGGGELNPSTAFDELDKLIFCKIWDEKKHRKQGEPYDFQIFREEQEEKTNESLTTRIKSLYNEGKKQDPEVFKDDIRLSPEKLRTVVGYLEGINLVDTDLDSKGRAFETFMGSFFRGDFGQFFTPRNIVKFIVDVLPITNDSLVLDTSCGSGGFLLHVLDKIRKQADEYYPQEEGQKETAEHKDFWHDFAEKNLFGIEINEQIARTAKMNMIIHDDGHTNVISADGLLPSEEIIKKTNNQGFSYNRFDFIITNPPFGSIVKQTEQAYMQNYGFAMKEVDWLNPKSKQSGRENQNTEILFIEQCYKFLCEGGYLAIVIPDGILTNSSLQYVRDWIEEKFRIVGVVSLPQTAFQATGAGVKSSILFLKKHDFTTTEKIQQQILGLQDALKNKYKYLDLLKSLEKEKKEKVKNLDGFNNVEGLEGKALKDSESFKEWTQEINNEYRERIDEIKANLLDDYLTEKQKLLHDYSIFMAIAEDIGYDATGKATNNNELDVIGKELTRFIDAVNKGNDSFFLSEDVDKNKVFLVSIKELDERIDPNYYRPFSKLIKYLYKPQTLSNISTIIMHPPEYKRIYSDSDNGIQLIRSQNVRPDGINMTNSPVYLDSSVLSDRDIYPSIGDILIVRSGVNAGDTATIIEELPNCIIGADTLLVKVKEYINPKFIQVFFSLSFGKEIMERHITGATNKHISPYNLAKVKIPILPLSIQNQIVAKMDNAYTSKKQKEAEAQKLLDSIDDYLLGELGIELPQPSENTVSDRIFYRKLSDISGSRFDPNTYQQERLKAIQNISNGIYPTQQLYQVVLFRKDISKEIPEETIYIGMENIVSNTGEWINTDLKETISSALCFHKNDILFPKLRPYLNKVHYCKFSGLCSTEFHVLYSEKESNKFLANFLLSRIIVYQTKYLMSGNTLPRLQSEDIRKLLIPIPPLEKQNEIAEHITKIREKAKQLQAEAKIELEQAKIEVEKIILGE
ncbi:MAG: N-6 DNA methylase [Nostocales cyanobacterium LacPavin_0920_SED1_MAG_38_18]|nr:N-6 DNA methylase [Nostocales cyanobacterium LacPavin_0920_SED1_MAG_38_18]